MSLKAIAEQELARLKAGEIRYETERETRLKQVKQAPFCFIEAGGRFTAMKQDERRKTAGNGACFTVSLPRAETRETSLPSDLASGLARLKIMRAPRLLRPDAWSVAVADALALANDGWITKALAMGWRTHDLFGAVTDPEGDPYGDGLVVWLTGRKLLAISETTATVEDGSGWAFYHRHDLPGARLLWEIC